MEQGAQITMSPTIGKLAEALSKAQGEMGEARKEAENPYFRSKYADLATCWGVAREPLSRHGLAVVQTTAQEFAEIGEASRKQLVITVHTVLMHSSGEWISGALSMPLAKNDPQGVGSAVSYGRRYGLSAILGIVGREEDDDGNSASIPPAAAPAQARVKKTPAQTAESKEETRARAVKALTSMLVDDAGLGLKAAEAAGWIRRALGRDDITGMESLSDAELARCLKVAKAEIDAKAA